MIRNFQTPPITLAGLSLTRFDVPAIYMYIKALYFGKAESNCMTVCNVTLEITNYIRLQREIPITLS